jgi:hypothetical protein
MWDPLFVSFASPSRLHVFLTCLTCLTCLTEPAKHQNTKTLINTRKESILPFLSFTILPLRIQYFIVHPAYHPNHPCCISVATMGEIDANDMRALYSFSSDDEIELSPRMMEEVDVRAKRFRKNLVVLKMVWTRTSLWLRYSARTGHYRSSLSSARWLPQSCMRF